MPRRRRRSPRGSSAARPSARRCFTLDPQQVRSPVAPVGATTIERGPGMPFGEESGSALFSESVAAPIGTVGSGSSLLAVLAGYVLPGVGGPPASTMVMFILVGLIVAIARALRPQLSERAHDGTCWAPPAATAWRSADPASRIPPVYVRPHTGDTAGDRVPRPSPMETAHNLREMWGTKDAVDADLGFRAGGHRAQRARGDPHAPGLRGDGRRGPRRPAHARLGRRRDAGPARRGRRLAADWPTPCTPTSAR